MGDLRSRYGKPFSESKDAIMELVTWHAEGNHVAFVGIGSDMMSVSYKPLVNDVNKKL